MDRYEVIGNPVSHSRSPWIHSRFALQTGQSIEYQRHEVVPEQFEEEVHHFFMTGGCGLNITLPFKERACALTTQRSPRVEMAGAANTLGYTAGVLWADNTDGVGLVRDLAENLRVPLRGARVLLLGAGGAARGVVQPLLEAGVAMLDIINRSPIRARELVSEISSRMVGAQAVIQAYGWDDLPQQPYDVVLNATATAVTGSMPDLPATLFTSRTLAYDLGYGSGMTPFMMRARERGADWVVDGLGMLVEQAAESFFLWRGVRPETMTVLQDLRSSL
ncbi:MAG: shikimate dehydrogenase [Ferrovum sp.]|nr:shikimate dehydrogenase [Ferrovum sp.]NDU87412.1 shikimate dehydrogenase [Ferrovum sp.]